MGHIDAFWVLVAVLIYELWHHRYTLFDIKKGPSSAQAKAESTKTVPQKYSTGRDRT